ncbi:MAG: hypothetical protein WBM53_03155 [Maribacter sp.]
MNLKIHVNLALGYFIMAAVFGVVLRSFYSVEIPVNYKFIVHAHSHIALLGWVYMAITTLLYKLYLQNQELDIKYRRIFWFTQFTLVGMLLSFPIQGYGLFSIIFSTLFLFASYWFTWFFINNVPGSFKKTNSFKCVKLALWYMVLSSLGPWALGGIMNTMGAESIWYRMSIYFYLHFQYNGWMVLALLGILLFVFEEKNILISNRTFKQFFWSMNLGIVLTFFLSTLWTNPPGIFYFLGGLGALLQIIAILILVALCIKLTNKCSDMFSGFQMLMFKTIAMLLLIKIILQLVTAFPYFSNLAATITDFTIGYLHWTFLGVVTIGLFLFLDYLKLLRLPKNIFILYIIGFVGTEGLIFYKGIVGWQRLSLFNGFQATLAIISMIVPIALIVLLVHNLKKLKLLNL